jgi:hypothetical protein
LAGLSYKLPKKYDNYIFLIHIDIRPFVLLIASDRRRCAEFGLQPKRLFLLEARLFDSLARRDEAPGAFLSRSELLRL